jgi:hypothetical protein
MRRVPVPAGMNDPLDPPKAILPTEADCGGQKWGKGDSKGLQMGWDANPAEWQGFPAGPPAQAEDGHLVRPV